MLEEKREAFELFKELMLIGWKGKRVKIIAKEEEIALFIKEAYDRWTKELKRKFIEICELFERKWKDAELKESPSLMYHG
jgi:Fe-S oxidoreductase